MYLSELTDKIKITKPLDAPNITVKELSEKEFTIYDYEIRRGCSDKNRRDWVKCLVGYPEIDENGFATGNILAAEFHGSYQYIVEWLLACERSYKKEAMLPIERCRLDIRCGVIFEDSTVKHIYIDRLNPPPLVTPPTPEPLFPYIPPVVHVPIKK